MPNGRLRKIPSIWRHLGVVLLLPLFFVSVVQAAGTGAISQSYNTSSTSIVPGTLVSSVASASNTVEPANSTNKTAGLVGIAANKPLLELSDAEKNGVQVVVSGSTQALVSDINGTIKIGDKIAASPISGIGMKAIQSSEIVGTAQADLAAVPTTTRVVTAADGRKITVTVGLLSVAINVTYYSAASSEGAAASLVPPFLQAIANTVAGRQVSPLRVLIGASALVLGFITVTIMLYASIRSGVISIGRNPYGEGALRKALIDVGLMAIGVLVVTAVIVYGVLLS